LPAPDHITAPEVAPRAGAPSATIYNRGVRPFSRRVLLAFDAGSVTAALVTRGLRGPRVKAVASERLGAGALLPSALEHNLHAVDEVSRAIQMAWAPLGSRSARVTLVLPHGASRIAILDLPRGQDPIDYARFRLAAHLPYPSAEAMVDFLPLAGNRVLAAAVRRDVVAEYEAVAVAAGLTGPRVDLAPLAAAAGSLDAFAKSAVFLVLGDAACALLAYDGGRLLGARTRRRDHEHGEPERLRLEALRTATEAGLFGEPELAVAGSGARNLLDHWAAEGRAARLLSLLPGGGTLHEAATRPWLAAALV
jgi:hypothetical protein